MTFTLDAQVAEVLTAAFERSGPPPAPPAGDVASRRVALDAMLRYFNNEAQPVAGQVDISDHSVTAPDGATLLARWYRQPSSESRAAVLYLHGACDAGKPQDAFPRRPGAARYRDKREDKSLTSPDDQFNQRTIAEFRASHGRVGGNFDGAPLLLLHTVGARSGQQRVNPVMYLAGGDWYLVFASKAGSDRNPDWYWNLKASPDAAIEVGDETVAVRAAELTGTERDEKYRIQSERYPGFAAYQEKTSRTIPVIALTRRDDPQP